MMTNMVGGRFEPGRRRHAAVCCCGVYRPPCVSLETSFRQCARGACSAIRATAGASRPKKKAGPCGPVVESTSGCARRRQDRKTIGYKAVIGALARNLSARTKARRRFVNQLMHLDAARGAALAGACRRVAQAAHVVLG